MTSRRSHIRLLAFGITLALGGCVAPAAPPHAAVAPHIAVAPHHAVAPPDWFHRQLALARQARASHLPAGDKAGAQHAYFAVMVPACGRIASAGPDKYRARCRALVDQATTDSAAANAGPECDEDRDDSGQTTAQIAACSD